MARFHRYGFAVCFPFLLSAFTTAQNGTKPADAIRAADQDWLGVFAAKNLEKSVAFCDQGGAVVPANAPIAKGREAIGKLFSGFFTLPEREISWRPDRAEVAKSGELGYNSGAYEMTFKDPTGKTIPDRGKYPTVWKSKRMAVGKCYWTSLTASLLPEGGA